jgi:hypothetical protein
VTAPTEGSDSAPSDFHDRCGRSHPSWETCQRDVPLLPMTCEISPTWVLHHGERSTELDPVNPEACLCGRYDLYLACPDYLADDGISGVTIYSTEEATRGV